MEDFKTFLQYVKQAASNNLDFNLAAVTSYKEVLFDFMAELKQHKDLIATYDLPPHWYEFTSIFTYQTHVHKKGWGALLNNNQISNALDKQFDIQAIKIDYLDHKVYYSVYYNKEEGWSQEVTNKQMAGTTGKGKPIYGMKVRLDEEGSKKFDILYRMHKFDGTWTAWTKNGEPLYSQGQKLNAIQIKLEPAGSQTTVNEPDITQLKDDETFYTQRQDITQLTI